MRALPSCLLLLATALAAAEPDGPPPGVRLGLDALPRFAFADAPLDLLLTATIEREKPRDAAPGQAPDEVVFSLEGFGEKSAAAGPWSDRPATARWILPAGALRHGAVLKAAVRLGSRSASGEAVALRVDRDCGPLRALAGGAVDPQGRRAIMLVPRSDESTVRRWRPLRELGRIFAPSGPVLLLAGPWGKERFRALAAALPQPPLVRQAALTDSPALDLVLTALTARRELPSPGAVVLFPGDGDARRGTPPEDFAIALHAVAAIFDGKRPAFLGLALPPACPADPSRNARYEAEARRVAKERFWTVLPAPPPSTTDTADPGEEAERSALVRFASAAAARERDWLSLLPLPVFFLCGAALLRLRRLSRPADPQRPRPGAS